MFRAPTENDFDALARLEAAWSSEPWSPSAFADFCACPGSAVLLFEEDGTPQAYASYRFCADYAELINLAVAAPLRRRGLARALLTSVLCHLQDEGVQSLTLEVRESNAPARALYESLGASAVGRRKNFYRAPMEDAILYCLTLNGKDDDLEDTCH